MGLPGQVKRTFQSIIPVVNRAQAGIFTTYIPHGAGLLGAAAKTLTGGAANVYGALANVLAATANTTECWIEGVILANPQVANKHYYVLVTTATAAVTAAAQIAGEIAYHGNLVTDVDYVPLGQRVHIPAGVPIGCQLAESSGGKTCDVWVVISRNK